MIIGRIIQSAHSDVFVAWLGSGLGSCAETRVYSASQRQELARSRKWSLGTVCFYGGGLKIVTLDRARITCQDLRGQLYWSTDVVRKPEACDFFVLGQRDYAGIHANEILHVLDMETGERLTRIPRVKQVVTDRQGRLAMLMRSDYSLDILKPGSLKSVRNIVLGSRGYFSVIAGPDVYLATLYGGMCMLSLEGEVLWQHEDVRSAGCAWAEEQDAWVFRKAHIVPNELWTVNRAGEMQRGPALTGFCPWGSFVHGGRYYAGQFAELVSTRDGRPVWTFAQDAKDAYCRHLEQVRGAQTENRNGE